MQALEEISIIIPVFNAEETLHNLIGRIAVTMPSVTDCYEAILVNDGSYDRSWAIIKELALSYPWVRGIDLMRNYGQHNATLAGISVAQGEIIVTMDADGEHPPEEITTLLATLQEAEFDAIYGYARKPQHEWWRNTITSASKWLFEKCWLFPEVRRLSAFRVFRKEVYDLFEPRNIPYVTIDVLLNFSTNRFGFVPVNYAQRHSGKSSYNLVKMMAVVMNAITAWSLMPVHIIEGVGVILTLTGISCLIFADTPRIWIPGAIGMGTGMVLLAIGIIGEYVARHYLLTIGKPQALIRKSTKELQ